MDNAVEISSYIVETGGIKSILVKRQKRNSHCFIIGSVNRWYKITSLCVLGTQNNVKGTAAYWNSCQVSNTGWISTNLVKDCLNVIYSRIHLLLRKTGMLILEAFKDYLLSAVKIAAKEGNSDLVTLGGTNATNSLYSRPFSFYSQNGFWHQVML